MRLKHNISKSDESIATVHLLSSHPLNVNGKVHDKRFTLDEI
jgi:hypothetical protein